MNPAKILDAVCSHFGVTREEIRLKHQRRQSRKVVEAKQVASYLLWQHCPVHRDFIYVLLDYTNPTAITKNIGSVRRICSVDKEYQAVVIKLETAIEGQVIKQARKEVMHNYKQLTIC